MASTIYPASAKQIAFIQRLLSDREVHGDRLQQIQDEIEFGLSSREASAFIEELKHLPWISKADKPESTKGFLGAVGEKISFSGVVTFTKEIDGRYGTKLLVAFRSDSGHVAKTFGTGSSLWDLESGDRVTVQGSVKSHENYQGEDQTMLTRVKVSVAASQREEREAQEQQEWEENTLSKYQSGEIKVREIFTGEQDGPQPDETPMNYNSRVFGPPAGFKQDQDQAPAEVTSSYRAKDVSSIAEWINA